MKFASRIKVYAPDGGCAPVLHVHAALAQVWLKEGRVVRRSKGKFIQEIQFVATFRIPVEYAARQRHAPKKNRIISPSSGDTNAARGQHRCINFPLNIPSSIVA